MENQIKYRFRRMELELFSMFEENYDKDVKEVEDYSDPEPSFLEPLLPNEYFIANL